MICQIWVPDPKVMYVQFSSLDDAMRAARAAGQEVGRRVCLVYLPAPPAYPRIPTFALCNERGVPDPRAPL